MTVDIFKELHYAIQRLQPGPLLLHCDLFQCGIWRGLSDRQQACQIGEDLLLHALNGRTALIPTFNYSFCKTGVYDVEHCPSQVGALSDYLRQKYCETRTQTPVFHFCQLNRPSFSLAAVNNCFGGASTFAELIKQDGAIGFLGDSLSSNTFIHHVEEAANVSYRFHKQFSGVVKYQGQSTPITLTYRVRPLDKDRSVTYDWKRLESDLRIAGILQSSPVGMGLFHSFQAATLMQYWSEQLLRDPHYLLVRAATA